MIGHEDRAARLEGRVVGFARVGPATLALGIAVAATDAGADTGDLHWQASDGGGRMVAQAGVTQTYAIPAGPLAAALNRFSGESRLQLVHATEIAGDARTDGVRGPYTQHQALRMLLAGTGITYRFASDDVVTLDRASAEGEDGGGTMQLGTITVEGQPGLESAYGPVAGYAAKRSASATKTDTPIADVPASIEVVPAEVASDQAATRLRDVYRNVSGVQPDFTGGNVSATEAPIIRGFEDFNIYRNGFRSGQLAPVDLANVERIEVLKGPASVLYGLGQPGGLLNIITKRPLEDPFATLQQEFGSYYFYRTTIDANAPLTADGSILGRVNLAYTSDETFRDHKGIDRVFLAPAVTMKNDRGTELNLEFSYSYEEYPFDNGLAFSPDGQPVADIATFLGEPRFRSKREEYFASYVLTHEVDEQLTLRNAFQFQYNRNDLNAFRHFGSTNPNDTVDRFLDRSQPIGTVLQTTADAQYAFELGPTRHDLLAGLDYRWEPEWGNEQDGPRAFGPFPIDIVNPQHNDFGPIVFDGEINSDAETRWVGVYVQDQISLFDDRLHLLLGGRYDYVDQHVYFNGFEASQTDEAFTGRAGILYNLTPWLSPYFSVSQSFNPTSPFTTSVDGLDPETGLGYEAGLKLSVLDDRLSATLAAFQITKDNAPVQDPDDPDFSVNGGRLRSEGVELDVAGELAPGWQIIANYAYTDSEVLRSDVLPEGGRFRNVPLHSGGLWTTYELPPGSGLDGFGIGGGVFGASNRVGDDGDTFDLDSFVRFDFSAWYRTELPTGQQLRAQINVLNGFDEEYYESSAGTASVVPGQPLTVVGSLSLTF